MSCQSLGSPNHDSFVTPPWESREKVPFEYRCGGVMQRLLYGGRWWLPSSPGAVVNLVSPKSPMARPSTKGAPESELTNLWLVGCRSE
jgi:hypothetical protein